MVYDLRYQATLPFKEFSYAPIVIIDIDEQSLQQIGRWPWPRRTIAELNSKLISSGAVVVGYDVIFSEPQQNIAKQFLAFVQNEPTLTEAWQTTIMPQAEHYFDEDRILAESFAQGEVVLGYLLHNEAAKPIGQLPEPLTSLAKFKQLKIHSSKNYTANLPQLQQAAFSAGFTSVIRDSGGIVRRSPIVMEFDGKIYGSLAFIAAKSYLLANKVTLETSVINNRDTLEAVWLDNIRIPTDQYGQVLIPFRGKRGSFPYISASDVLNNKFNANDLAGKIALVGTSALGLADLHATAIQDVYPGVEAHASIIAGILAQNFPTKPVWSAGANLLHLALTGLILAISFSFLGPITILTLAVIIIFSQLAINVELWLKFGFVLDIVAPIFLVVLLVIVNTAYGFLFEMRRKRQITNMFGQYVSKDLVDEMSKDPEHYSFAGQTKQLTVLFSDIRGFTTLSETMSATDLKNLLNNFFSPMTEIIFHQNGTIDKYVGDMIMAFWGAPKDDPRQANNAVIAAFNMLKKTNQLQQEFAKLNLPLIDIGVGINTGNMHVGDMGSNYRRAYTVLGDEVNLGSRLEGLTKFYGVKLIIGTNTYQQLEGMVCRQLDLVKVKGKKQAVAIYEPLGLTAEISLAQQQELTTYKQGLAAYFSCDWATAKQIFAELHSKSPTVGLYGLYEQRVINLEKNPPPPGWDGAYVRTEK